MARSSFSRLFDYFFNFLTGRNCCRWNNRTAREKSPVEKPIHRLLRLWKTTSLVPSFSIQENNRWKSCAPMLHLSTWYNNNAHHRQQIEFWYIRDIITIVFALQCSCSWLMYKLMIRSSILGMGKDEPLSEQELKDRITSSSSLNDKMDYAPKPNKYAK